MRFIVQCVFDYYSQVKAQEEDCKPRNLEDKLSLGKLEIWLQIPSPLWAFKSVSLPKKATLSTFPNSSFD